MTMPRTRFVGSIRKFRAIDAARPIASSRKTALGCGPVGHDPKPSVNPIPARGRAHIAGRVLRHLPDRLSTEHPYAVHFALVEQHPEGPRVVTRWYQSCPRRRVIGSWREGAVRVCIGGALGWWDGTASVPYKNEPVPNRPLPVRPCACTRRERTVSGALNTKLRARSGVPICWLQNPQAASVTFSMTAPEDVSGKRRSARYQGR